MDPEALLRLAQYARGHAHAPYSRLRVGAAILGGSGQVYTGCNVENASYGLSMCAERAAVFAAIAAGERHLRAVAVLGGHGEGAATGCLPCGACRQVLYEFAAPDLLVWTLDASGHPVSRPLAALLPDAFHLDRPDDPWVQEHQV